MGVEVHIPSKQMHGKMMPPALRKDEDTDLPDELIILESLHEQELTAIGRLEKSNEELLEALVECEDDDFRQAVNENIEIVGQKRLRCAKIAEKIRQLKAAEAAVNPQIGGYNRPFDPADR